MTTPLDLIKSAFRKIGATTFNEAPDSNEAQDALSTLNQMIESWSSDSLTIYERTRESFSLTGASSYTVGSGGDFDTVPFTRIVSIYARQGDLDYSLSGLSDSHYDGVSLKAISGAPEWYNYSNGFPLGTLRLYPIPDGSYTLYVTSEKPITSFTSLAQTITLPPGWERALIYNLAIDLAPEYGQPVSGEVAKIANDSLAAIRRQVSKQRGAKVSVSAGNVNNIYGGWTR